MTISSATITIARLIKSLRGISRSELVGACAAGLGICVLAETEAEGIKGFTVFCVPAWAGLACGALYAGAGGCTDGMGWDGVFSICWRPATDAEGAGLGLTRGIAWLEGGRPGRGDWWDESCGAGPGGISMVASSEISGALGVGGAALPG